MKFHFFNRISDGNCPAGITVSKTDELPQGDFYITEYEWPEITLWFIDGQDFTADERQKCYEAFLRGEIEYEGN